MSLANALWHGWERLLGHRHKTSQFEFEGTPPETEPGSLAAIFWANQGPIVHKWLHYLPIYESYLEPYRGSDLKFLEIGVSKGGSLQMWREYFGDRAVLFGIDIDPECAKYDGQSGQVRIGSQDDPEFLARVIDEMGGVDVVLDDGSHDSHHIRASLNALYPKLSEGGLYMIEDLHCAYWPKWSGGYGRRNSFMRDVKAMIDDMHHWYHGRASSNPATKDAIAALHVYDSLVVLEKRPVARPEHVQIGSE